MWKTNFFLGKLYKKFVLFYTFDTLGILHAGFGLIWTTPWPDKKDLILKLFIWNNSKFPCEKLIFFLGKLYWKFVLFYNLDTLGILRAEFGLIWTTPWPDKKDLFLKFFIWNNSKFPCEKLLFFPRQAIPKTHSVLHFRYTWNTP